MTTTDQNDRFAVGEPAGQRCVLVVEDEALVRMVVVDLLESLGFQVEEAASAAEALEKMRRGPSRMSAAIVDLGLPDRRGDALAADMRAMDAAMAIVIASGYGEDSVDLGLRQDPQTAFLAKPYDMGQLRSSLESLGIEAEG
ncbi:MAG: response regulator [Caulobacteraceae bacterium]